MSEQPWYWTDAMNDHDSCGLVLGVGRSGNIHYLKADQVRPRPACNSGAARFIELVFHGQLVTCRNCCSIAKHNRHKIKTREPRSSPGVIAGASRTNFIRREQRRRISKKEGTDG